MGEFAEDKVMGFGKLWHEDGDVYTGYWKDYQAHGVGIYTTAQNANYEGYWYEDKQSGFGIESVSKTLKNGSETESSMSQMVSKSKPTKVSLFRISVSVST